MTAFVVESWIWYSVTLCMVIARMTARLMHFKSPLRLQIEDFLMVFLTCLYTILIVFLNIDLNVSTNLIDPAHPVDLTPEEISKRTWGSKTVLLVEQCMCAVQWGTKICLLLLYWRLTQNLKQALIVKCAAVYVTVTYIVMEILYFGVWCRPFHDYWKTPTDNPQCPTALHHLITNLVFNVTSDLLIMSIPLPLLIRSHLELKRKILLVFPFTLGLFTILCAILSKRLSFSSPYSSEWVYWYCREASTAMIVTNMPYSWALVRRAFNLRSFLGDSTAMQMQGGQPRELHGYNPGTVALESHARSRQDSQIGVERSRLSWANINLHRKGKGTTDEQPESSTKSWTDPELGKSKEANVETTPASSGNSSDGSVRKPPQAATTDWTLDRLYPLDDEEIGCADITQRRYEG